MPLTIFDMDSIKMNADRKCKQRYQRIRKRFFAPETETAVGEMWNRIRQDTALFDNLRQAAPKEVKAMEVRYGKS
jgi:hypothetical protein